VRGAPGRGASNNPSRRWVTNRARHLAALNVQERRRPTRAIANDELLARHGLNNQAGPLALRRQDTYIERMLAMPASFYIMADRAVLEHELFVDVIGIIGCVLPVQQFDHFCNRQPGRLP
jgi:hypothetical protein